MAERIFEDLNDWFEHEDMTPGKRKVLKAAVELFATQGFDGTSTAQISELSEMSQGTIFKYFKTKRDLLKAIIEPLVNNLIPNYGQDFITKQVPKDAQFEDLIHFVVRNRLEFMYTNRDVISIFVNEIMINNELLAEAKEKLIPVFLHSIDTLQDMFNGIKLEPENFIRLLAGQLLFEFMRVTRFSPAENYDLDEVSTHIANLMIAALK